MNTYDFGYPEQCTKCDSFVKHGFNLRVAPYLKENGGARLMLVGQDPTIFNDPERVKHVLMLDDANGQLSRWLRNLIGHQGFDSLTLYATNIVKCTFTTPPSTMREGGLKFLQQYFHNCRNYLIDEVAKFRPSCILTLGEPTHKLFVSLLDNRSEIPTTMQGAFTGQFIKAHLNGVEFDYSPCLHIKTFRVAEVYGENVKVFKDRIKEYFTNGGLEPHDAQPARSAGADTCASMER
jgi:uracil-DNA glycosylase